MVRTCIRKGINFFDTAELYGYGVAERCLGRSLKNVEEVDREEIVVTAKFMRSR